MITSLVEALQLPNFGHVIISTIQLESRSKIWWRRHGHKFWRHTIYFSILCFFNLYFSKFLYFKKAYRSHFYWHPKNCNHVFLKKSSKTWKRLKELEIIRQIRSKYVFLRRAKFADYQWKNTDFSRTQGVRQVIYKGF